jgi:CheY-like chemotaxis protein
MSDTRAVTIVLVEDDPGHAWLVQKNLHRAGIDNQVVALNDGQKAIDFFLADDNGQNGADLAAPYLILLDLNLPVVDGYQVLQRIKGEEQTKRIPVIILTTTDEPREVSRCYDLGCSVYITKPVDYDRFSEAIRKLGFFLSIVTVPEKE